MKKITLNFGIIICSSIFSVATHAQTNVIALKSHAGEMADVLERDDNFGIIDPRYEYSAIDSVKYDVKTKSIVNYRNYGNDTISYLNLADTIIQEHLKSIRLNGWYPKTTKFIDFPEEIEKSANQKSQPARNSIPFWFAGIILLGLGGNYCRKKRTL